MATFESVRQAIIDSLATNHSCQYGESDWEPWPDYDDVTSQVIRVETTVIINAYPLWKMTPHEDGKFQDC